MKYQSLITRAGDKANKKCVVDQFNFWGSDINGIKQNKISPRLQTIELFIVTPTSASIVHYLV